MIFSPDNSANKQMILRCLRFEKICCLPKAATQFLRRRNQNKPDSPVRSVSAFQRDSLEGGDNRPHFLILTELCAREFSNVFVDLIPTTALGKEIFHSLSDSKQLPFDGA